MNTYTAFNGIDRIAAGPLDAVALVYKHAMEGGADGPVLIFDDTTGNVLDLDTRGTDADVLARLPQPVSPDAEPAANSQPDTRGRGRPKLGVVAREVTLLPRHWEWLSTQPGGASVALRKLVEEARRANVGKDRLRQTQERAYHFMLALAGDMPGFEEASRALFADDPVRFAEHASPWPTDVRDYAIRLAFGELE